jgi:hypothetical protein
MAKALYGFSGGPDPRVLAELASLRSRVHELESEVAALRAQLIVTEDLQSLLTTQDAALV